MAHHADSSVTLSTSVTLTNSSKREHQPADRSGSTNQLNLTIDILFKYMVIETTHK